MRNTISEFRVTKPLRHPLSPFKTWRIFGVRDSALFGVRVIGGPKSTILIICLLTSGFYFPASAQHYSIDSHTMDGGGGTSTGGVYSISGTIGQPDASTTTMTGGSFSLSGGFWSLIAVQTPGAPTLTIVPAGSEQATISWSPDTPGFVLQETLSFSPTNWMNSASGSTNPITVPSVSNTKFYRLFKP